MVVFTSEGCVFGERERITSIGRGFETMIMKSVLKVLRMFSLERERHRWIERERHR